MGTQKRALLGARLRPPFGPLMTPHEVMAARPPVYDEPTLKALRAMVAYVTGFLTSSHPLLGRSGAVCPFAAKALAEETIRLTAVADDGCTEEAVVAGMEQLRTLMTADDEAGNRALIAVFPRLREPEGALMIERIQTSMKLSFVRSGLMLGEFYPSCTRGGLWNDDFKALQAPVISLAVRNMTIYDAPFMLDREAYADAFVDLFGETGQTRILKARQAAAERRALTEARA